MGITDAAKEALHLIGFLKELECDDLTHVTIYNDNQGAKMLANNSVFHSRSKHIDIRYHFIREVLRNHTVELTYISSERMIADVLTKALSGPRHLKCILGLGLQTGHRAQLEGECWKSHQLAPLWHSCRWAFADAVLRRLVQWPALSI